MHLGERECSIQRRHQKLLEESPSPALTEKQRRKLGNLVVDAARAVQYTNAGTFEFLMDEQAKFYFMEANTRLQVEHPVTELVTGIDIVKEQIRIAAGERLSFRQGEITFNGHAIECRVNAEDPETFVPSPGHISVFSLGGGPGIRVDTAAHSDCTIPPYYDSMIAKVISYGRDRHEADRAHEARAGDVGRRRRQDDDSDAPAHPERPRFSRGPVEHEVHGALRAGDREGQEPRRGCLNLSPLNAIIDDEVTRRSGWTVPALADAYLAGGARFIQIRSKHAASGAFLEMCEDVVARARKAGAIVIVNDRADIAKLSAADGVHVGQDDLDPASARRILGGAAIVGVSTHSPDQVRAASALAVDYIAVGPIFGTSTKETGYRDVGTAFVSEAASDSRAAPVARSRSWRSAGSRSSGRPM